MDRLADELLKMILSPPLLVPDELFADGSDVSPFSKATSSASDVLLVCKRFMRIATPALYETVIIRTKAQAAALQSALTRNPEFGRYVRKLRLEGAYGRELAKVMPTMPHVTDLCFTLAVYADDSLAGLTSAFATVNPSRVVLTLADFRRAKNNTHKALVAKLCAAIPDWTNLKHFRYSSGTYYTEYEKEPAIADALATSGSVETVDLWHTTSSWDVPAMPSALRTLLTSTSIRLINLHHRHSASFLAVCPPDVQRRIRLVDTSETATAAPELEIPAANPFYHPMQNASSDERVRIWSHIVAFAVAGKSEPSEVDDQFLRQWYRTMEYGSSGSCWFNDQVVDLLAAGSLLLISRDLHEAVITVLARHLAIMYAGLKDQWFKILSTRPTLGAQVESMQLDTTFSSNRSEIDSLFEKTPNLRHLDLGAIHPASIESLSNNGTTFGHSLRTLALSSRRTAYHNVSWKHEPFTSEIFNGFVALEHLTVTFEHLHFKPSAFETGDVLPNLKVLEVHGAHASLFTMLSRCDLPKIQELIIRAAVKKAENFIEKHGSKLIRIETAQGFNQKHLNACPNLETIKLREDVKPAFSDFKHPKLRQLRVAWTISGPPSKHKELCRGLSSQRFPALKEVLLSDEAEIWPSNERDIKKSPWPAMAELLAEQGIVLKDHTGRAWRQRLQIA